MKLLPDVNMTWAVTQNSSGNYELLCIDSPNDKLVSGKVLIQIEYSSLNYKDALSVLGKNGETRDYPQAVGIDLIGVIKESCDLKFKAGTRVARFSHGLGTTSGGGIAQFITSDTDHLILVPESMSPPLVMAIGTAGLTAAACVAQILEQPVDPSSGSILITGAGGGVGKIALLMLSKLGYKTVAATRGGTLIGSNATLIIPPLKPTNFQILPEKWVAVIDTLGGNSLATALKSTRRGGVVMSVGNVEGSNLNLNISPFVLRGVKLIGINLDLYKKEEIEKFLISVTSILDMENLMSITRIIDFNEVPYFVNLISQGKHSGRTVVKISPTF
jgi:acrylyl-CoA reductase (NADPH)